MGHRPRRRNPEPDRGVDVARARAPCKIGGAGGEHPGVAAVAASQAEVVNGSARGGLDDPGGLRGDKGRVADRVEQESLDPLGLRQGRVDPQERLAREHHGPLGDRPDVTRKPDA